MKKNILLGLAAVVFISGLFVLSKTGVIEARDAKGFFMRKAAVVQEVSVQKEIATTEVNRQQILKQKDFSSILATNKKSHQTKRLLPPQEVVSKFSNSVEHGDQYVTTPRIPTPIANRESLMAESSDPMVPEAVTCTSQDVIGMTTSDWVTYLRSNTYNCIYFIWTYDVPMQAIYTDAYVLAVLDEINTLAPNFNGTNINNMRELMAFVHAAYYLQFFYPNQIQLSNMVDQSLVTTLNTFSLNTNFNVDNTDTGEIMYHWLAVLDASELAYLFYSEIKSIVSDYQIQSSRWGDYSQDSNVFIAMNIVSRARINNYVLFNNQVDQGLMNIMEQIALNMNLLNNNSKYVIHQAIWAIGSIASDINFQTTGVTALSGIMNTHVYLSTPYLWVLTTVDFFLPCPIQTITVCKADIIPILETQVFPHTYRFDDGAMVVKTSLSLSSIQELYHASKEVQGQFDRISKTILPVQNDTNGVLTMKIYGTMTEYHDYHQFLYNLPTNNGGIYIESNGTFYTYQRTTQQSIYTLEELFRHEYAHYLVGRYFIQGLWGQAPIYANNRVVWFDEGFAEFIAWSTSDEGVKTRKILVQNIMSDGTNRMTVNEILHAQYGNFRFYQYAGLFFNYLYTNDRETLHELIQYVHDSNISSFDALIVQLSNDSVLESAYQNFLDSQINIVASLDNTSTVYPALNTLNTGNLTLIQQQFQSTTLGQYGTCSIAAVTLNARFSCRGTLTSPSMTSRDYTASWNHFNASLDSIINELHLGPNVNNFDALNCRMGHIRFYENQNFPGQYHASSEYYCDGPLAPVGLSNPIIPLTRVIQDFQSTRLGVNAACSLGNQNEVICNTFLTTSLVDNSTPNTVLSDILEDDLIELQSSVYAIRPPFYMDFSCSFPGNGQVIQYGAFQKYMTQNSVCVRRGIIGQTAL